MRSVERSVSEKLVPSVVSEAVKANRPRPGFSAELLGALKDRALLSPLDDPRAEPLDRWVVPGVIAGAICGAGLLCFELGRRSIRTRPGSNWRFR